MTKFQYLLLTFFFDQALEKHCRAEAGYSGIQNVYMETPQKDDVQQSFIFAETFKVLLLFTFICLSNVNFFVFYAVVMKCDIIFPPLHLVMLINFSISTVPVFDILG